MLFLILVFYIALVAAVVFENLVQVFRNHVSGSKKKDAYTGCGCVRMRYIEV